MATLVSPSPAKRGRLSLVNCCAPSDAITNNFFPETYCADDNENPAFECTSFYGQQRKKNVFQLPPAVQATSRESTFEATEILPDLEEKENVKWEEIPENPPLNISCLPNCGNTCYLNSVLHVLRYTPNFLEYLHYLVSMYGPTLKDSLDDEDNASLVCFSQLHKLYSTMRKQEEDIYLGKDIAAEDITKEVSKFISILRQATDQFEEDQQHDAHEFLVVLVTGLPYGLEYMNLSLNSDTECPAATPRSSRKRKKKRLLYSRIKYRRKSATRKDPGSGEKGDLITSPVSSGSVKNVIVKSASCEFLSSIFNGQLCQLLKCMECEKTKERQEAFFDLKVPLAVADKEDLAFADEEDIDVDDTITLLDCLMKESWLDGENKYFCNECRHHNEAKLSYKVVESPSILLLHLSWLSELSGLNEEEKCGTQVKVPLVLGSSSECIMFSETDAQFSLYGAIVHIGSTSLDGHYVSFIKIPHSHDRNETCGAHSSAFEPFLSRKMSLLSYSDPCCSARSFCDTETDTCARKESWYLFDDDTVTAIDTDDTTLPYLKYLGTAATPYMLFYQRL